MQYDESASKKKQREKKNLISYYSLNSVHLIFLFEYEVYNLMIESMC